MIFTSCGPNSFHGGLTCPSMLQGHYFYRIIDQFIDQSGAETESVFGGRHWHAADALAGAMCVTCMGDVAGHTELLL